MQGKDEKSDFAGHILAEFKVEHDGCPLLIVAFQNL
jgi:hypothetical protein